MYCPNCGANNSTEQNFCRACGSNLEETAKSLLAQIPTADKADLLRHEKVIGLLMVENKTRKFE